MNISKFQIITLAIFIVCIIAGTIMFANYKGSSSATKLPAITIWGTFPKPAFDQYVSTINNTLADTITVNYVQENPNTFSQDFISALARGTGPDVILIPADMILPHEDKVALIPYTVLPQRTFLDTYIDEAQIYVSPNGILGIPFTVDPLMMYWNKDMFNTAGVAIPPKHWGDFTSLNTKLTVKDQNGNIRKSAVAMGDFNNVTNARELLGSLLLQIGNPVTRQDITKGTVSTTIINSYQVSPVSALQFFTQFVDPTNVNYSWNRSMPDSRTAFLSGTLATYFGFSSELNTLRTKNPNLNFDVANLPQTDSGSIAASYGKILAFSLIRSSPNTNAAFQIISTLTNPTNMAQLAQTTYSPSVRRDVIGQGSNDPYLSIFNQSALISRTWLDIDPYISNQIFGSMIQSITSGQKLIYQAIQDAGDQYDLILKNALQQ